MFEFQKDFTFNEVSEWITVYYNFFFKPRITIKDILIKNKEQKTRQFLFFFFVYAASFIFLSVETSLTAGIKPAILNLFYIFPIAFIFGLVSRFFGKKYIGGTLAYIIIFHLIAIPIINILTAIFFTSENYTYYFIQNIFSAISSFYMFLFFGYAIEQKFGKATFISLTNFLIVNLIILCFLRINFDPYSQPYGDTDLIYQEYSNLVKPLNNKELIPTYRTINNYNDKISTDFLLQEVISGKDASGSTKNNDKFIFNIEENIKHIQEATTKLAFNRNREIAYVWLNYLKEVQRETNYKVKDIFELEDLKPTKMFSKEINGNKLTCYYKKIDYKKMLEMQVHLKWYNNSIIENHNKCVYPSNLCNSILVFPSNFLNNIISKLLGEKSTEELKFQFDELE
ncbi:hypothetical protein [Flavobacterium limi]|uniref:Uncharacterized protein n=1 Tax=Flavobacterium limi TaxID=2045105 RepID=A0ABQ1UVL3_9FLAO|nr:hypothetical protein [Flavobacterium limi]GGF28076.1 hypothetical protein GCM10011518_41720 [Flavobacterium limi]